MKILKYLFIIFFFSLSNYNVSYGENYVYVKKLNFVKYTGDNLGDFTGIKKNRKRTRGITWSEKNFGKLNSKSDFYGTYTKKNTYWKGYFKHYYKDRTPLYSYVEYENNGKYKVVDSFSVSRKEFEIVKKLIYYDVPLPFDFKKEYVDKDTMFEIGGSSLVVFKNKICVSKSFNADYRQIPIQNKCTSNEREIPRSSTEYMEAVKFIDNAKQVKQNASTQGLFLDGAKNKKTIVKNNIKLASTNTNKYITKKKSNNTKAIEEIEKLYSNGLLSKKECVRAKIKILKLDISSNKLCDNVKVRVTHKDDKSQKPNKFISKKEKEKRKSYITKKNKDADKKLKRKKENYKSINELPNASIYFFAFDKNEKLMIGYVNPDPKSEIITLNGRSFNKEAIGFFYKEDGTVCDVLSTIINSRSNRIYIGQVEVNCPKGFFIGSWVQNGNSGNGKAMDEKGNELGFYFHINKREAIASLSRKKRTEIVTKPIEKKSIKQQKVFTPKIKQDKEAPKITTKMKIVSNSPEFVIEGFVKDNFNHKQGPFLEVMDEPVELNKTNGKFSKKLFSPFSTQITIAVTDIFGNRNEIAVDVVIKEEAVLVKKLDRLDPSKLKKNRDKNKIALIIGIEKYENVVSSSFSNLDAKYFTQYIKKIAEPNNVITLVDEKATRSGSYSALAKKLKSKIIPGQSEVIIFFSGHGLAENEKDLYLLVQDSDSDLLEFTALKRDQIIKLVASYKPKSVIMFLDTCYSGTSRKGEQLIASARPVTVKVNDELNLPNNFSVFSASQASELSFSMSDEKQGIFSYYLMKGLEGNADLNNDRKITNGEIYEYLRNNVPKRALQLHSRNQNPTFSGSKDQIIFQY